MTQEERIAQLEQEHTELRAQLAEAYQQIGQAESVYQQVLQIYEQRLEPDHPELAASLSNLAILYEQQGKYAEAGPLYQWALHIWEQQFGPDHLVVSYLLRGLAKAHSVQGEYAEAESLYQRALHIWEQQFGPDHPRALFLLNSLATFYCQQGKYTEAEPLYERVLRVREQQKGSDQEALMASALNNLANLYFRQSKFVEAEPLYLSALSIREQILDQFHPDIADNLYQFALLQEMQENFQEAASLYQRALQIREKISGPKSQEITVIRERLHSVLSTLDRIGATPFDGAQLGAMEVIGKQPETERQEAQLKSKEKISFIKMEVDSVRIHVETQRKVIILKTRGLERYLFIWADQPEADAVAVKLQGVPQKRPLSFDTMKNIIDRVGGSVHSIIISDLIEDIFSAYIRIFIREEQIEIDATPSVAIALAVRCAAPIFVEKSVLERAGVDPDNAEESKG